MRVCGGVIHIKQRRDRVPADRSIYYLDVFPVGLWVLPPNSNRVIITMENSKMVVCHASLLFFKVMGLYFSVQGRHTDAQLFCGL